MRTILAASYRVRAGWRPECLLACDILYNRPAAPRALPSRVRHMQDFGARAACEGSIQSHGACSSWLKRACRASESRQRRAGDTGYLAALEPLSPSAHLSPTWGRELLPSTGAVRLQTLLVSLGGKGTLPLCRKVFVNNVPTISAATCGQCNRYWIEQDAPDQCPRCQSFVRQRTLVPWLLYEAEQSRRFKWQRRAKRLRPFVERAATPEEAAALLGADW